MILFTAGSFDARTNTSLSKLAKLSELSEQYSGDRTPHDNSSITISKELSSKKLNSKNDNNNTSDIHKKRSL